MASTEAMSEWLHRNSFLLQQLLNPIHITSKALFAHMVGNLLIDYTGRQPKILARHLTVNGKSEWVEKAVQCWAEGKSH